MGAYAAFQIFGKRCLKHTFKRLEASIFKGFIVAYGRLSSYLYSFCAGASPDHTRKRMNTSGQEQQQAVMPDHTVEGWLSQVGMGQYLPLFVEHHVRPEDLRLLNDDFLQDMGIQSIHHRKKILAAPKPVIKNKPLSQTKIQGQNNFGLSLKILNIFWLAPFCAGLCCFIAEVCFIAVGLPTLQSADVFGTTALLGACTVLFSLLGTQNYKDLKKGLGSELVSIIVLFLIYTALIAGFFQSLELTPTTFNHMMISWAGFVGLPMMLLRKLLLKGIQHIFGLAFVMAAIFATWEVLLFGYLNGFNFMGNITEQQDAWAFTLLAIIRSLSVFLFYARGALDIRLIMAKHANP